MKTDELSEQEAVAWTSFRRMRTRLNGRLNRELAQETGLSEADLEILVALSESPNESVRALALRCGLDWEKSRLSHQLRRMEQRGLVIREPCPEDNRSALIHLTATGRQLAEEARVVYERAVRRWVYDALTPDQIKALGAISETLLAHLEEP
jgi:DNA-binding MarR family transcriptional regulator